jgi:glyoxylase-like metal-dependent hydrolase (beta-lactamase superfamily II)
MSYHVSPFYEQQSSTWTYLLADQESAEAVIIDPVWVFDPVSGQADRGFIDQVLAHAREAGWFITWVLETHAHADHLSCADLIRRETGARIGIGEGICGVQETFAKVFNLPGLATDGSQFDRLFADGEELQLGQTSIRVMATPGHTNDSVSYCLDNAAFIGDTLFSPTYGSARCDFPGGDAGTLFDSVQRLYALGENTKLYLCHDYPEPGQAPRCAFSVAEMRAENIHINEHTRREDFVAMREQRDQGLSLPRLILPSLQVNVLAGASPAPEDNGVAYLKLPFNTSIADILAGRKQRR